VNNYAKTYRKSLRQEQESDEFKAACVRPAPDSGEAEGLTTASRPCVRPLAVLPESRDRSLIETMGAARCHCLRLLGTCHDASHLEPALCPRGQLRMSCGVTVDLKQSIQTSRLRPAGHSALPLFGYFPNWYSRRHRIRILCG
jgi:hypothetical protein